MNIPKIQYELYYNDHKFIDVVKRRYEKTRKFISVVGPVGISYESRELRNYKAKESRYDKNRLDVISINYEDRLSGELDSIDIIVSDPEQKWISNWKPEQADTISGRVYIEDRILEIQEFSIDEITYSIYPNIITIKGLSGSVPKDGQLKKRRYQKYKETTLQAIVSGIAQRNNLIMQWNGDDVDILSINQNGRSDLRFVNDLAKKFGFYTKLFTRVKKKKGQSEKTKYLIFQDLTAGELSVSWEGEQVQAASGSGQRYITVSDEEIISGVKFKLEAVKADRKERLKYQPYDSKLDKFKSANAKRQGIDRGKTRSRYSDGPIKENARNDALEGILAETKTDLLLSARPDIVAGCIVYFDSNTSFRGTYLVWDVTHNIDVQSGWTTKIGEMRRLSSADLPKPPSYRSTPSRSSDSREFGQLMGLKEEYRKNTLKKPKAIVN